jgi:uncharacterized protein
MLRAASETKFDGPELVRRRGVVSGGVKAETLRRLEAFGCTGGSVAYSIAATANALGKPALQLRAHGELHIVCQRCLGNVLIPVAIEIELEIAASRDAIESADDDVERVVAGPDTDAVALVEDELILALPMVPMHETCAPGVESETTKVSPFAVLQALRRGDTRK